MEPTTPFSVIAQMFGNPATVNPDLHVDEKTGAFVDSTGKPTSLYIRPGGFQRAFNPDAQRILEANETAQSAPLLAQQALTRELIRRKAIDPIDAKQEENLVAARGAGELTAKQKLANWAGKLAAGSADQMGGFLTGTLSAPAASAGAQYNADTAAKVFDAKAAEAANTANFNAAQKNADVVRAAGTLATTRANRAITPENIALTEQQVDKSNLGDLANINRGIANNILPLGQTGLYMQLMDPRSGVVDLQANPLADPQARMMAKALGAPDFSTSQIVYGKDGTPIGRTSALVDPNNTIARPPVVTPPPTQTDQSSIIARPPAIERYEQAQQPINVGDATGLPEEAGNWLKHKLDEFAIRDRNRNRWLNAHILGGSYMKQSETDEPTTPLDVAIRRRSLGRKLKKPEAAAREEALLKKYE